MAKKKIDTSNKQQTQDTGKPFPLLRISNTTIAVAKITKLILDIDKNHIEIKVENCTPTFTFQEDSLEKAYSLFLAVAEHLKQTQAQVPFLFFESAAIRLDLINVIRVSGSSIIIRSGVDDISDFLNFESDEAAQNAFDDLMTRLQFGAAQSKNSPEKEKDEKPPDNGQVEE